MSEFTIEVVYALPEKQRLVTLAMGAGATVADAIADSGLVADFPDFDFATARVGIWGHEVERGRELRDGDRVEIYRILELEPREARRRLALSGRTMRGDESTDSADSG